MSLAVWARVAMLGGVLLLSACGESGTPSAARTLTRAASVSAPVKLSGESPFTGNCGLQGEFTPNREGSPHIAADPTNPDRIVVAWMQHRQANGGWLGGLTATTRDGGKTWSRALLPASTQCTGGGFPHAVDPWVGFGADGRAFVSSIATTIKPTSVGSLPSAAYLPAPGAVLVHRSDDGGASWSPPFAVDPDDQGTLEDRDTLTPDPGNPRRVYVAWGKFVGAIPGPNLLYFSHSEDGGATFSPGRQIYAPAGAAVLGVNTLAAPDGTLVVTFAEISVPSYAGAVGSKIRAIRSTDGGATWSSPVDVAEYCWCTPKETETGAALASAGTTPSSGIAPDGTLYIGWVDQAADGAYEIRFSRSADDGATWSTPAVARRVLAPAMLPALAAGAGGKVAIVWHDLRNDVAGDQQITADWWMAYSGDHGQTWNEAHLAGPFDLRAAHDAATNSYRIGDYFGVTALNEAFAAVLIQATSDAQSGPTDVYFVRVDMQGT